MLVQVQGDAKVPHDESINWLKGVRNDVKQMAEDKSAMKPSYFKKQFVCNDDKLPQDIPPANNSWATPSCSNSKQRKSVMVFKS